MSAATPTKRRAPLGALDVNATTTSSRSPSFRSPSKKSTPLPRVLLSPSGKRASAVCSPRKRVLDDAAAGAAPAAQSAESSPQPAAKKLCSSPPAGKENVQDAPLSNNNKVRVKPLSSYCVYGSLRLIMMICVLQQHDISDAPTQQQQQQTQAPESPASSSACPGDDTSALINASQVTNITEPDVDAPPVTTATTTAAAAAPNHADALLQDLLSQPPRRRAVLTREDFRQVCFFVFYFTN